MRYLLCWRYERCLSRFRRPPDQPGAKTSAPKLVVLIPAARSLRQEGRAAKTGRAPFGFDYLNHLLVKNDAKQGIIRVMPA